MRGNAMRCEGMMDPLFLLFHPAFLLSRERKRRLTVKVSCRRATRIHERPLCFHSNLQKDEELEREMKVEKKSE
jgi:hypothetical protein